MVESAEEAATPAEVLHLVENLQRVDLTGAETARAVFTVIKAKIVKQKALAAQLGKSEPWVSKARKAGEWLDELAKSDAPLAAAIDSEHCDWPLEHIYEHAVMADRRAEQDRMFKEAEARREAEAATRATSPAPASDDQDDDEDQEGDANRQQTFVRESSEPAAPTLDDAERALRWMQIDRMRAVVQLLPERPLQDVFFDQLDHLTAIRDEKEAALTEARRAFEAIQRERVQQIDTMRCQVIARWSPAEIMEAYYQARKAEDAAAGRH